MKRRYLAVLMAMMFALPTVAQNGLLFNLTSTDILGATDMLDASRENPGYATARVAAMGGAFTSLGADVSSMAINPAGLGMYRRSEVEMTAAVVTNKMQNNFDVLGTTKTRFSFNSFGAAINVFQSSDDLRSMTFGLAYNKLDDYNYNSRYSLGSLSSSITDVFASQMAGVSDSYLGTSADPYNNTAIGLNQWGGIMAYDTYLIDPVPGYNDLYFSTLEAGMMADSYMDIISKGSKGEYDFSLGMNFNDNMFFGMTLGIQDVYHKRDFYYTEDYSGATADPYVQYMGYNPYSVESGVGVNLKLGAIFNPVAGLRMGIAFHTPTYYSMDKSYVASMWSKYSDEQNEYYASTLVYDYTYEYNTPAKMLVGLSYTIGNYAIISLDYDRVWYQSMRSSDFDPSYRQYIKQVVKENFKGANNVRIGLEFRPASFLSLRGGYAMSDSPYKEELENGGYYFDSPIATRIDNFSFGVGFNLGGAKLDFAAIFSNTEYTDYDVYYYQADMSSDVYASPLVENNELKRGMYTMTFSLPF